jgi:PAS domain S-box-containing protein
MQETLQRIMRKVLGSAERLGPDHPARAGLLDAAAAVETLLGKQERVFRPFMFMVNAAREPMTLISREHRYDAVNDAFRQSVAGLSQEPVGLHVADVWGRKVYEGAIAPALEETFQGRDVSYTCWFSWPGQPRGFYEVCYHPYRDAEGEVTHTVVVSRDLTAWRRAADSARASEERYRSLVENINDVIFSTDALGMVTFMSPAIERLTGQDPAHYEGHHLVRGMHPEDEDRLLAGYRSQDAVDFSGQDFRMRTRDGGAIWVRISLRRMSGPYGPGGATGLITDITESKLAGHALARSERRYRNIFENIQDVYFETSPDGVFLEVSPSVSAISGFEREELIGVDARTLFRKSGQIDSMRAALVARREAKNHEVDLLDSAGRPHVCSVNVKLVWDEDFGGMKIVGSLHDVSGLKKAEADTRQAKLVLDEIIQAAPDPISIKDERHRWTLVNAAFCELFDCSPEDVLGRSAADLLDVEEAREIWRGDAEAFAAGFATQEESFHDSRGEFHVLSTHKAAFESPLGGRLLAGISRDVTGQKRMEEALRRAKEAAEVHSEAKTRFLANMSHEIRTPLNGVMGMLQLLLLCGLDEEQNEYATTALESARGLLAVINDILDLSKIEAGRLEIALDALDVRALAESVMSVMGLTAEGKGIAIGCRVDDGVPERLMGGSSRIRQILFNLVGNAVKFTEEGEVLVEISYLPASGRRGPLLLVCVHDTGVGIPDEGLPRIFEHFTQVDESHNRRFQGAGLGLAIVQRLVELMDGSVSISSTPGEGTTVCCTVAVAEGEAPPPRPVALLGAEAPRAPGFTRALVAEGSRANLLHALRMLSRLGISAVGVDGGEQAVQELERAHKASRPYDLVLLDVRMPRVGGMEALRRIRAHARPEIAGVRVVALAAPSPGAEGFSPQGADGFAAKPLEPGSLREVLRSLGHQG